MKKIIPLLAATALTAVMSLPATAAITLYIGVGGPLPTG